MELVKIFLSGNAHIDPIWLWMRFEGFWTVRHTVRHVIDLMKRHPSMTFVFSSAIMYKWLEECEPQLFEEVRRFVKEGRWIPVGGWWVEPDCNLPCGESYVRHALYGKSYFKKKLCVDVKIGYNIDSFGHNASLPQILRKSGYEYYIFMRPGSHEKRLPSPIFWWESPDGSRVLAYRHPVGYALSSDELAKVIESIAVNPPTPILLILFGKGDHGGGPTDKDIETICRVSEKLKNCDIRFANPEEFFKSIVENCKEIPVVRDEMQHHASGCYSVLSEVKALNRRTESMLMSAERLSVLAYITTGLAYPREGLRRGWELTLLCQFHDVLAGTCIAEAYWDIRNIYGEALNIAYEAINMAIQRISSQIDTNSSQALVVFNPTGVRVRFPIEVEPAWSRGCTIVDENGEPIPTQEIQPSSIAGIRRILFIADVPAVGYRVYKVVKEESSCNCKGLLKSSSESLENDYFIVEVDTETGSIKKFYDKRLNVNVFNGYGASAVVLRDESDTWSHGVFKFRFEEGRFGNGEVALIESGPVRATLRVKTRFRDSTMWQYISLYRGLDFVDVKAKVDWRERHKMLKLSFPVNLDKSAATYEIPYGVISRPTNGEEEPGQRWIDVSGRLHTVQGDLEYGLAVINDSKYGFDVYNSDIRMSILRSPPYAQHDPHKIKPGLDYRYIDQGEQTFKYILLPHKNDWRSSFHRIAELAEILNTGFFYILEDPHKGRLPNKLSLIDVVSSKVVLSALKLAEETDSIVARLVEYTGRDCNVRVRVPILDKDLSVYIKPYEIKTLIIPVDRNKPVMECNLMEEIVS